MARNKIEFPQKKFDVAINIPVRITDVNYGNHVGNDSLVSIVHEARVQLLQQYNFTELNAGGAGLIMADLTVEFKNESFYKDIIHVTIGTGKITEASFELIYQLTTNRSDTPTLIANATTTMVCYDYALKKVVVIPEKLKDILS